MILPATPVLPQNMMAPADLYAAFSPRSLAGLADDTIDPCVFDPTLCGAGNILSTPVVPIAEPSPLPSVPISTLSPDVLSNLQQGIQPISSPVTQTLDIGQPDPICAANPSLCSQVSVPTSGISLTPQGRINPSATDVNTANLIAALARAGLTTLQMQNIPAGSIVTQHPDGTVTVTPAVAGGIRTPLGSVSVGGSGGVLLLGVAALGLIAFAATRR